MILGLYQGGYFIGKRTPGIRLVRDNLKLDNWLEVANKANMADDVNNVKYLYKYAKLHEKLISGRVI